MMLRAAALLALIATPALAQQGGAIRGGEHGGFSRIVLRVDPRTEWSLDASGRQASILFRGRALRFDTDGTFDRMPRSRIRDVTTTATNVGTRVDLALGCDCSISASFVEGRYLALDVSDRGTAPPPSRADAMAARDRRETAAVVSAESILIRQIEHAASQGLIEMVDTGAPGSEAGPLSASDIGRLSEDQITATTVFDRDGRPPPDVSAKCLPDARLDLTLWSDERPIFEQRAALEAHLLGEFDRADPEVLADLLRLDIRNGLGEEASQLLAAFDTPFEDRATLADLARIIERKAPAPFGPMAAAPPCPGWHGLWQVLAGADTNADADATFALLPPDLRAMLGPPLVQRLLGRGDIAEARRVQDLVLRSGIQETSELTYTEALLAIGEGRREDARGPLGLIAASQLPEAPEALLRFARLSLDQNAVPVDLALDLATAARTYRGTRLEAPLRALAAEAQANAGHLPEALAELTRARAELPAHTARFEALTAHLLATADPEATGAAAYAKLALDAPRMIARDRAADPARAAIARNLLALGLPKVALDTVAPGVIRGDTAARLVAAEAELRLGEPEIARALTEGMDGPAIAQFRARALADAGSYSEAVATLRAAGLDVEAGPYAWAGGDWERVQTAENPRRRAMAAFMAGTGPEPGADAADAAFAAPLPALNRPSLAATRQLLDNGPHIDGFVRELIAPAPDTPDPRRTPGRSIARAPIAPMTATR